MRVRGSGVRGCPTLNVLYCPIFRVIGGDLAQYRVRRDSPEAEGPNQLWVGCVAGALSDYESIAKLAKAGFDNIDIEPTRVYSIEDARAFLLARGLDVDALAREVEDKFISAFVRASKPATDAARPVAAPEVVFMTLSRRIVAEGLGTAFLLAAVVGSLPAVSGVAFALSTLVINSKEANTYGSDHRT
jgi:hypothetical protein